PGLEPGPRDAHQKLRTDRRRARLLAAAPSLSESHALPGRPREPLGGRDVAERPPGAPPDRVRPHGVEQCRHGYRLRGFRRSPEAVRLWSRPRTDFARLLRYAGSACVSRRGRVAGVSPDPPVVRRGGAPSSPRRAARPRHPFHRQRRGSLMPAEPLAALLPSALRSLGLSDLARAVESERKPVTVPRAAAPRSSTAFRAAPPD